MTFGHCGSCAHCPGRFGPPIVPCAPRLAHWAHRLAPNCITHPHWMYKRPWHLARPLTAAALAAIRECVWRTHRQIDTTFAVCKQRPRRHRAPLPLATNVTQRASPFPSWATERKERDDQAWVLGPVSVTAPGNTRAWFMAQDPGFRGETGLRHRPGLILTPVVPHTWAPLGPR
jgi:hypothetical protein